MTLPRIIPLALLLASCGSDLGHPCAVNADCAAHEYCDHDITLAGEPGPECRAKRAAGHSCNFDAACESERCDAGVCE